MLTLVSRDSGIGARVTALAAVFVALMASLLLVVRPWSLSWGTTPAEWAGPLPRDGLVPGPIRETRAIAVEAPAAQVFAWLSQIGQDRAGFYSYELLEDLVGCEMPNLRHLDPALQHWSVGSKLWMYPPDELGGLGHATLLQHEPGRALVFGTHAPSAPPGSAPTGSWSFVVEATGASSSRLLTRSSGGANPGLLGAAYTLAVFEPLHFAMERRMLEGIKGLSEGRPLTPARDALQLASWLATLGTFLGAGVAVLLGRDARRKLLLFSAAGMAFQVVTLVQPDPLVCLSLVAALALLSRPPRRASRGAPPVLSPTS